MWVVHFNFQTREGDFPKKKIALLWRDDLCASFEPLIQDHLLHNSYTYLG